jgi:hypothetical protein
MGIGCDSASARPATTPGALTPTGCIEGVRSSWRRGILASAPPAARTDREAAPVGTIGQVRCIARASEHRSSGRVSDRGVTIEVVSIHTIGSRPHGLTGAGCASMIPLREGGAVTGRCETIHGGRADGAPPVATAAPVGRSPSSGATPGGEPRMPPRVAVIGCGRIAAGAHLPAWQAAVAAGRCTLAGLTDLGPGPRRPGGGHLRRAGLSVGRGAPGRSAAGHRRHLHAARPPPRPDAPGAGGRLPRTLREADRSRRGRGAGDGGGRRARRPPAEHLLPVARGPRRPTCGRSWPAASWARRSASAPGAMRCAACRPTGPGRPAAAAS